MNDTLTQDEWAGPRVAFAQMLNLDDVRWTEMNGGYKMRFDPRPLLTRLESAPAVDAVWHELWGELHHQGDVGDASFAAVPHLVRISRSRGATDWNVYALVAVIELARGRAGNPDVPNWLEAGYFSAIRDLAETGAAAILRTDDPETARAILSILAIEKGLRTHSEFLLKYSDQEMLEIVSQT
jgi:hypothetical protein